MGLLRTAHERGKGRVLIDRFKFGCLIECRVPRVVSVGEHRVVRAFLLSYWLVLLEWDGNDVLLPSGCIA